ncbi:MAG: Fic family protein [Caldilineaceae bacterium]
MFQPIYHISPRLLDTIKRVTVLVHELNKWQLSEPQLAALRSEALVTSTYASTSIEGNPLSLTEVRRILKSRPAHIRQSEREVLNYNAVLEELYRNPQQPFTTDLILTIHRGVVHELLPAHQTGRWRLEPVVVHEPRSGGIVYLPPDHDVVPQLMTELVTFIEQGRTELDPLLLAGIFHKQFVVIHPFVDGNGRTARLATNVLLASLGVNLFPLLSFENYYNQNVTRYFKMVGVFGDYYALAPDVEFTPWLEYFADGILDELRRLADQLERQEQQRNPSTIIAAHHQQILAYIDQHGFITDKAYAGLTDRAKATRSLDFRKLIEMGLIERLGVGRSTYYRRVK